MSLHEFLSSPWDGGKLHKLYSNSFLHMRPAPEYASGEVVLASTYRNVGFVGTEIREGSVPKLGRDFQKRLSKGKRVSSEEDTGVDADAWAKIISGTLRSPKQPNQTSKRFLQISPVVPDASIYSLSARLSSNSWNPGALVAKAIQFGDPSKENAQKHLNSLFHALSVGEDDDIWARFLQREFESWRSPSFKDAWKEPAQLSADESISLWHKSSVKTPAVRFSKDLIRVISLKKHLTRRQWVSMLEATLRLGTASHIFWLCRANQEVFSLMREALKGLVPQDKEELSRRFDMGTGFWRYGQYSGNTIRDASTSFVKARIGISLILHQLEETVGNINESFSLGNIDRIYELIKFLAKSETREKFDIDRFQNNYQDVIESDPRRVSGKKGISSNVKEFLQHVLAQRQTAESGLDSYDQGYFLAKSSSAKSSRWIVSLGPVSVLALVYSCTHGARGPRTIENFCQHLGEYGIEISAQEVSDSMLGKTLRNLGLVLDSPDAEGGMVLVNPFENISKEAAES